MVSWAGLVHYTMVTGPFCSHSLNQPFLDMVKYHFFAGCHRFDQSAINILFANHYNFNSSVYRDHMAVDEYGKFVSVNRYEHKEMPLRICADLQCVTEPCS